jgi:flagellar P-ring protein precursor FlgI
MTRHRQPPASRAGAARQNPPHPTVAPRGRPGTRLAVSAPGTGGAAADGSPRIALAPIARSRALAAIAFPNPKAGWRARRHRILWLLAPLLALLAAGAAAQPVRIKDIADIEGVRDNQLVGYGLVVGLAGTGDRLRTAIFTRQSLVGMLERLGVNTRDNEIRLDTRNVAAVMVTANLPAFARPGSRIDVAVSALGDATNLQGGTLLVTPLLGADGEVYAVAQGAVATGAIAARGAAGSVQRGVPTSARIASGAIVEREIPYTLAGRGTLRLSLRNPDLTTARRIAAAINRAAGAGTATATDPRTVALNMAGRDPVTLLGRIEPLRIEPDQVARIIIEEASGTIVMGANVRVSTVAVAQGNLTIRITETPQVSQPNPLGGGATAVVPRTDIEVDDQADRRFGVFAAGVTLQELVRALNALGIGPRDMIPILQSIKAAGALQAELELR